MQVVLDNFDVILKGFGYTIALFLISAVISLLLGTLLVAMRVGPVAVMRKAAAVYVTVVRNTPLLIVFLFFVIAAPKVGINFRWLDVHVGPFDFTSFFGAAIAALSLYTSTFVAEALRSGVNAVSLGQSEAARAVGLTFAGGMRHVVLPQAVRAAVPPLASTMIALVKNTSVAAVFGVAEAVSRMRALTNNFAGDRWEIFIVIALGYIILVEILSAIAIVLERRWRIA